MPDLAFPPPDIAAALKDPTVTSAEHGYDFVATSPAWKVACAPLPSCAALQWPGYATTCIAAQIDGVDVIIQPWMGYCEQFLGRSRFPGGIGGEVGVYVKVPRGRPLPDLQILPAPLRVLYQAVALMGGDHLWWPDPRIQPDITFSIINPKTKSALLGAGPEKTYWLNKWMDPASYDKYRQAVGAVPSSPTEFEMVFTVAGVTRRWRGAPFLGG